MREGEGAEIDASRTQVADVIAGTRQYARDSLPKPSPLSS